MVKVNGETIEHIAGKSVSEFLAENGCDMKRIAVELNGDILPKAKYESTELQDGDCVEIVRFVGGG